MIQDPPQGASCVCIENLWTHSDCNFLPKFGADHLIIHDVIPGFDTRLCGRHWKTISPFDHFPTSSKRPLSCSFALQDPGLQSPGSPENARKYQQREEKKTLQILVEKLG